MQQAQRGWIFWTAAALFVVAAAVATFSIKNEYPFFAGYLILQFMVLATAWNILGGYAGYVNFGTSAFFGLGVYTAVFLFKATGAPLLVQIAVAAAVGALLGFLVGLLTLRMRGIFFSIATIALTIIIETFIINWKFVGGATGMPDDPAAGHAALRQLHQDAVRQRCRHGGDRRRACPLHSGLLDRSRPARAARRRACRCVHAACRP